MGAHGRRKRIAACLGFIAALGPAWAAAVPGLIYGGAFDLRIPATGSGQAWMDDAVVEVPDHVTILDLDVGVVITHTSVFDLELILEGPDGTRLRLNWYEPTDEFFKGENYEGTIFDDEAERPIESGSAPFSGRYRPRAPGRLDVYDGLDAHGEWKLQIYDWWHGDTGRLEEVTLILNVPEPATVTLLLLGLSCPRIIRGARQGR